MNFQTLRIFEESIDHARIRTYPSAISDRLEEFRAKLNFVSRAVQQMSSLFRQVNSVDLSVQLAYGWEIVCQSIGSVLKILQILLKRKVLRKERRPYDCY